MRGNLVDLAVGFTVGASFSLVAKSIVEDIIMPPVGFLIGQADFSDLYLLLRAGEEFPPPYSSLEQAKAAGAVTINYGLFLNNVLSLILVAVAMFLLIRGINRFDDKLLKFTGLKKGEEEPVKKKCPYCLTTIPYKATKCSACTSDQPKQVSKKKS